MITINARAIRDDNWWVAFFDLDGREHGTQAKTLARLEYMVKDAASLLTGKNPDDFAVHLTADDPVLTPYVDAYRESSDQAREAERKLAATSRAAVEKMRSLGLSVTDTARLLGLTKGRVSQLAKS